MAIGLISFAAVAQFAPAVIGGIYWKGATRAGRARRPRRRLRRLALHAAAAIVRQVGLAADKLPRARGRSGIALLKPYALNNRKTERVQKKKKKKNLIA